MRAEQRTTFDLYDISADEAATLCRGLQSLNGDPIAARLLGVLNGAPVVLTQVVEAPPSPSGTVEDLAAARMREAEAMASRYPDAIKVAAVQS